MVALVVLLLGASSVVGEKPKKAVKEAQELELEALVVPADEIEGAWSRAQAWVSRNSGLQMAVSNDHLIQTGNLNMHRRSGHWSAVVYTVTRFDREDGFVEIDIDALGENELVRGGRHAACLARFIRTADRDCQDTKPTKDDFRLCLLFCNEDGTDCTPKIALEED